MDGDRQYHDQRSGRSQFSTYVGRRSVSIFFKNSYEQRNPLGPCSVHQMSILEMESNGEGTPQGVVLALVGPEAESSRDQESLRTLRMYNLASLISLAKYIVAQKVHRSEIYTAIQLNYKVGC